MARKRRSGKPSELPAPFQCTVFGPRALLLRRVIPVARADDQLFVAFHTHLYLVEQAVGYQRFGAVEDSVLVAHLFGDDLEGLGEVFDLKRKEGAAAGLLGEVLEDLVAVGLDAGHVGGDGEDHNVGFERHFEGLIAGVLAAIIFAVGDYHNHPAEVIAGLFPPQFVVAGDINGVVERGAAAGVEPADGGIQLIGVGSQLGNHFRVAVEAEHHGLVEVGAHGVFEKLAGGVLLKTKAFADAVAGIDEDAEAEGQVGFGSELLDDLRMLVLKNLEIVLGEIGDEAALFVDDGEEHGDARDLDGNARGFVHLLGGVRFRRRWRSLLRHSPDGGGQHSCDGQENAGGHNDYDYSVGGSWAIQDSSSGGSGDSIE